jgi:hypothetical protein
MNSEGLWRWFVKMTNFMDIIHRLKMIKIIN